MVASNLIFTAYDSHDSRVITSCPLQCMRCVGRTKTGHMCQNRVCIGVPMCWLHTLLKYHVKAKPSRIAGAGMGLFAHPPPGSAPALATAFNTNDLIVEYIGEHTTQRELDRIYNDNAYTVPYAWSDTNNAIDAACKRGIGSTANLSTQHSNAILVYRTKNGIDSMYHSYTGNPARPNAFPDAWDKLYVIATRSINYGDEILIDYGDVYGLDGRVTHTTKRSRSKRR